MQPRVRGREVSCETEAQVLGNQDTARYRKSVLFNEILNQPRRQRQIFSSKHFNLLGFTSKTFQCCQHFKCTPSCPYSHCHFTCLCPPPKEGLRCKRQSTVWDSRELGSDPDSASALLTVLRPWWEGEEQSEQTRARGEVGAKTPKADSR